VQQSDRNALGVLTGWATGQQSGIAAVAGAVPTGAQGALAASRDLVTQVAARGTALEQALACPGGPSTEGADELGPLPAACPPAPPVDAPAPSGSAAPGSVPSDTAAATSAAATATATPAPTTSAGTTASRAPSGGILPTIPAPATSARPGLSLPSLPSLPGLPGGPATSPAPSSSGGALVSVPPLVPGVSVCLPPLITVGC
jgi:hypothetical protein